MSVNLVDFYLQFCRVNIQPEQKGTHMGKIKQLKKNIVIYALQRLQGQLPQIHDDVTGLISYWNSDSGIIPNNVIPEKSERTFEKKGITVLQENFYMANEKKLALRPASAVEIIHKETSHVDIISYFSYVNKQHDKVLIDASIELDISDFVGIAIIDNALMFKSVQTIHFLSNTIANKVLKQKLKI